MTPAPTSYDADGYPYQPRTSPGAQLAAREAGRCLAKADRGGRLAPLWIEQAANCRRVALALVRV